MQKPRKITVKSDDGKKYSFLCKPKDDLRKDARLMDFNSMINKMLKTNSESRRRQLREQSFLQVLAVHSLRNCPLGIRTYGVVPLNEECGLIQWVPGTVPLRSILYNSYGARGIPVFVSRFLSPDAFRLTKFSTSTKH
jgi:serine/threonine-protein kinase ATR